MNGHPVMPVPPKELPPSDLVALAEEWAASEGFTTDFRTAGSEYGVITILDPANGQTSVTIPNPHRGRRLRRDQVRYTVQQLNKNWTE